MNTNHIRMRKRLFVFSLVLFVNGMFSFLLGQEKSQSYYNQHPNEILLDAQSYFKNGDYGKTISLCKLHYIIVGDSAADALRSKAELCERLTNEINERTEELRSANPNDPLVLKLKPVVPVLDSIHVILHNDGGTTSEIYGGSESTLDNKGDSITEAEKAINGIQWVDLGLPSGLKWATENVGATISSDVGNYYAWGEVEPKQKYKYSFNGDGIYIVESKSVDSIDKSCPDSLQTDVATAILGSTWRMPNDNDWLELQSYCNWMWLTMNGKTGYLVVSQKNGNSIFLPAGGYLGTRNIRNVGRQGYYWSSTVAKHTSGVATGFQFNDKSTELRLLPTDYGCCIRAVSD